MHNHAASGYVCPICLGIQGVESDQTLIRQSDIVFHDEDITVFIGSYFIGNNPGQPIIVPNQHFENLYDMPDELLGKIHKLSKKVAQALKISHNADGVMIQQNNEPASGQHAFHYHVHIWSRYKGDNLHQHMDKKQHSTPEQRKLYVDRLKQALAQLS